MDLNVRAFRVVQEAINGNSSTKKQLAARRGGLKGGPARAQSISPERRSAIAKKANAARWRKEE